jgi:hypothetical protein
LLHQAIPVVTTYKVVISTIWNIVKFGFLSGELPAKVAIIKELFSGAIYRITMKRQPPSLL